MGLKKLPAEPAEGRSAQSGRLEARGWRVGRTLNVHGAQDWPGLRVNPDVGHGLPTQRAAPPRLQGSRSRWRWVFDSAGGSGSEVQPRLARPALGRRLRVQTQVAQDLLDHRPLQDGGDNLGLTASLHKLRLLWGKQIAASNVRIQSYADRHVEILYDRTWSMAAVHFEDWITRKRSLRPSLWESAYVGYQAVTSVTARTALGRNPTSQPIPPSTSWRDTPPRSAQQTRRPRQAGQAGYQGEALAHWQPDLQLVMRVAALIHQQPHPQATLPGPAGRQLAAYWRRVCSCRVGGFSVWRIGRGKRGVA